MTEQEKLDIFCKGYLEGVLASVDNEQVIEALREVHDEMMETKEIEMTDNNEWTYMFSIVRDARQADIFISNGIKDTFRVVCMLRHDPREIVEDVTLDYCREVGEEFVRRS